MADILVQTENPEGEENILLEKNKFSYEIGSDKQIQDNQPEPEENSEETHQQRHGKK